MKKNIYRVLILLVPLLIAGYLIYINEITISVRTDELKRYLQDIDNNEGNIDHIALIATYEIHKKIYEERMSQDDADTAEHKLITLSLPAISDAAFNGKNRLLTLPALYLINFNRKILGKPPISYNQRENPGFRELDKAFYYERNFLFKRAITHYGKALSGRSFNSQYRSSILLRQGYCYAMAGLDDMALNNYNIILKSYGQESSAITASILIRYLEGFTRARERILIDKSSPVLKSRKLVSLLAYEQALSIIEKIENKSAASDMPAIKYFKARCYSGLGKPVKAIETYLEVITSAPHSPYAKYSNRKLYFIGKSEGGDNRVIEISKKINIRLKDPVLDEFIKKREDENRDSFVIPENDTVKADIPDKTAEKIKKFISGEQKPQAAFLIIITSDGNTFKGKLIKKSSDFISLQTSIGIIDVKRDKITQIINQD
ncbi:MAG TPA: hypothetical protein PK358_13790 [Spirochaetota bacterium]|nr:hypothetical protein [Spirochaetota bacterium]HPJ35905.1 hypothetical protein [Spirochaetota bacterium]